VVALGLGLLQRPTLRMDAMRDRAVLAREVEDGAIENTYQVLLLNARDGERAAALQVVADPALPGLTVVSDPRVGCRRPTARRCCCACACRPRRRSACAAASCR
jgi:hypothetical protein